MEPAITLISRKLLPYARKLATATPQSIRIITQTYKSELSQQNLYQNFKQYLQVLTDLCSANDISGRWLPTFIRIQISKILLKYK